MARRQQYQDLYLYMNGIHVGILKRDYTGKLIFTYDDDWLAWEYTRPISLSMPLTEIPYKGDIVENFFDNLLPDNELIRKRIQIRFNTSSTKCFDLLSQIGADCVGALQLLTSPNISDIKKISAEPINNKNIAALLKNYQNAPLGMKDNSDFRISIAGAQEKTALLWYEKKWHLPKNTTPTSHIIKLPIGEIKHSHIIDLSDSVENEWLCLQILSAYNLPVNKAEIKYFDDQKTLVVERFDRQWSEDLKWLMRLPQEDMCQALNIPPAFKYESDGGPGISDIMNLLLGSKEALKDREKFMKTVFLFWVMGAPDGHAKNFSLRIEPQGRYQLTPIYDVISAYPIAKKRQLDLQKIKMAMGLKSKNKHYEWKIIQKRHWLAMADYCRFDVTLMENIINDVFDNMENVIAKVEKSLPNDFPAYMSEAIFSGMRKVKDRGI